MDKFNRFRQEAPVFVYKKFTIEESVNSVDINYEFSIEGVADFHPSWTFSKPENMAINGDLTFERLAFSLGMAEAVSYWKACCSPTFRVECGELTDDQILWWKKLYFLGLGEFFYINAIKTDIESFVNIESMGKFGCSAPAERNAPQGCLVPIGGGKDSALTLETLVKSGKKCLCYAINSRQSISETVRVAGLSEENLIIAKRKFDRSLVELNKQGYLNGHTPFSSVVAFSAEITAYLHGMRYIVLSNEDSANESTVVGEEVNHQYSKSFEFERDFHDYEEKYLGTGISYFSFLRPLSEFQIAKMFVSHKKYLPVFRSCNLGSKVSPDIWCGDCPKCLFVSLILSPFLSLLELKEVFGKDLLNDVNMENYFIELIGKSEHKPFECVGSIDEVNLAVTSAIRNILDKGEDMPYLFQKYMDMGLYLPDTIDEKNTVYYGKYNETNLLPEEFAEILKNEMGRLL